MTARVEPILDSDLAEVGAFLSAHLNSSVPPDTWARAAAVRWLPDTPNHGFLLRVDGRLSGALLAFYSRRQVNGQEERFCNLGAWVVLPEQRLHSIRLLRAALKQTGFHFTDLSPSGAVVPLNRRLGFHDLDTATAVLATPLGGFARARVITDPARIPNYLGPEDLAVYRDHQNCLATRHAVLVRGPATCYVIHRRVRRKRLGIFASVIYVSDQQGFASLAPALARHLLVREGVLGLLVERRIAAPPRLGVRVPALERPKMFKSDALGPEHIDDLYSELCAVPW